MFHKKHEEIHQKIAKNFNKSNELIMKSPPFNRNLMHCIKFVLKGGCLKEKSTFLSTETRCTASSSHWKQCLSPFNKNSMQCIQFSLKEWSFQRELKAVHREFCWKSVPFNENSMLCIKSFVERVFLSTRTLDALHRSLVEKLIPWLKLSNFERKI